MADDVGIRFVGRDDVSRVASSVKTSLDGVTQSAQKANTAISSVGGGVGRSSGLDGLIAKTGVLRTQADELAQGYATLSASSSGVSTALIGIGAAAAGAAIGIGKVAYELGTAGEAVINTEKKFIAFTGGPKQAASAISAMRSATEGGINAIDAMTYSSMLLSMGLAQNGDDAARITRLATMLGPAYRDAATNIQDFTMLLANQSTRRLDQFGLSVEGVRRRQEELIATGLSKEQAFTNAVMEIGAAKMDMLAAAGVRAATGAQQLTVAWQDLRNEVGKALAPGVGGFQEGIAGVVRNITGALQAGSSDPATQLTGLRTMRAEFERQLQQTVALPADTTGRVEQMNRFIAAIAAVNEQLDKAAAAEQYAAVAAQEWGDVGTNAALTFRGALDTGLRGVPDAMEAAALQALDRWDMVMRGGVALPNVQTNLTLASPGFFANEEDNNFRKALGELQADNARELTQYQIQLEREKATTATRAWTNAASDVSRAWKDGIGDVKGELTRGMSVSRGLSDLTGTGGGGADDPNGWMQDIRRLQAWISDGSWGETAQKFGITSKEDATERIRKFQTGQWDESVTALIDKTKLADQIKKSGMATAFIDGFAAEVANESGQDAKVVKAMLGFQSDKNGAGAMDMKPLATAVTGSFNTEVNAQSAEFVKAGNTMFSYVGQGFIDSAKSSGLLLQAVQAMVLGLLPKQ